MNKNIKRINLFKRIDKTIVQLCFFKRAKIEPALELDKTRKYWMKFFGFESLADMNTEELENFLLLLEAKIKADYKSKTFNL